MADLNGLAPVDASGAVAQAEPASTILIVEDNPENQAVLEAQLANLGFPSQITGDGCAGLDAWRSGEFAAILTDCEMPMMDGFELARAVRAEEAEQDLIRIPIVAVTSLRGGNVEERCRAAGMDGFLRKPVSQRQLAAVLRTRMVHQPAPAGGPAVEPAMPSTAEAAPVLDLSILRETFGDDERRVGKLLDQFLAIADTLVSGIEEQAKAGNAEALADASHRLKSSSLTVGAFALAEACDALEEAGRSADWPGVAETRPRLVPALEAVSGEIRRRR
jgi:two-component system sensor histidine kinase EvgS